MALLSSQDPSELEASVLVSASEPTSGFLSTTNANVVSVQKTYAGGTTNDIGNFGGTGTPYNLFTVTGKVQLAIVALCDTTMTGATGTLSVGIVGATTRFIPSTLATNIVEGVTVDHTGVVTAGTLPISTPNQYAHNQEVVGTTGVANITAGVVTFVCFWKALSAGATVVVG